MSKRALEQTSSSFQRKLISAMPLKFPMYCTREEASFQQEGLQFLLPCPLACSGVYYQSVQIVEVTRSFLIRSLSQR